MTSESAKIAGRELRYLARVGAYRNLDQAARILSDWAGEGSASVPQDVGLVECQCPSCQRPAHPSPEESKRGFRGHDVGTFAVYAAAERLALEHLSALDEPDDLDHVIGRLKLGLEEGGQVRAKMLRLARPQDRLVPGRGRWLVSEP